MAAALTMSQLASTGPAQAGPKAPTLPTRSPIEPPAGPDTVAPADRDKMLPEGWRRSSDRLWTTAGDANGFHVLTATSGSGYTWETAASLSEPGFDVDQWIGNACLTGSGRRLVVVYAPRSFTNRGDLFDRGGFTAIVDLKTHVVTKLAVQSSLAYFNPGCGAGETAVLSQFGSERRESPADNTTRSRMVVVDAAARTVRTPIELGTELSSPVPVGDGIVAAGGDGLLSVAASGKITKSASAEGMPFRLVPDADGGVVFLTQHGDRASVNRTKPGAGPKVTRLAEGSLSELGLTRGAGGRAFVTGTATQASALPSTVRKLDVPRDSEVSSEGAAALTRVTGVDTADPRRSLADPAVPQALAISAQVIATAQPLAFEVGPDAGGPAAVAGRTANPKLGVAKPAKKAAKASAAGSADEAVDADAWCSVPRNDVRNQAVQPKPRNVEWAVDQAIAGKLNQVASRPANWKNYGMPAYGPQTLFAPYALAGGGTVPAQIMLGVIAQESNMWQAAKYALPGVPANPLMGNFYGRDIYNSTSSDDWDINWADADCGYGLTQATDGMRAAGHEKPNEIALPYQTQRAVALDFTANIAYGLRILQDKWNQTYNAGLKVHNADPSALENWFYAVWAYNSGFYPDKRDGSPWGVGWLNNPINPRYDPARKPFMNTTYDDARHPQDWPYPEKVMGWAGNPITATEAPGVEKAGYNYAWWSSDTDKANVKPRIDTFCDASNQCDKNVKVQPNDPDVVNEKPGPCLHKNAAGLYDLKCWAHVPAGWKAAPGAACNTCGHESVRFDAPYPWCSSAGQTGCESDGISYPPACSGPSDDEIVDDVRPGDPSPRPCATGRASAGSFNLSFTGDADGTYPSKIDFHQVGGGWQGHYWRASTRTAAAEGGRLKVSGTWKLGSGAKVGDYEVKVFVPEFGAWTEQAKYTIDLGNGETRYRVINQTWQANKWISLGTFNFRAPPAVSLTTVAKDGTGDDSIIFDAVAFHFRGVNPARSYVALGDSYSSGEGLAPYDRNSDLQRTNGTLGSPKNACHRAQSGAWPTLVRDPYADPPSPGREPVRLAGDGSFGFIACSGALTTAVTTDAVNTPPAASDAGGHTDWGKSSYQWGELTQVEQGWLDKDTDYVSVSIGGNDVRFTDILKGCIASIGSCAAADYKLTRSSGKVDPEPLRDYETKVIRDWLPAKLKAVYRAVHRAAPNAQIVVMGYPQMFPDEAGNNACWNIGAESRLFLNVLAGRLSIATANAVDDVRAEGVKIRYVDPSLKYRIGAAGDKHWACDGTSGKQWLNGITSPTTDGSGSSTPGTGSWHPTSAGHQALADLMSEAISEDRIVDTKTNDVPHIAARILAYVQARGSDQDPRWTITQQQATAAAQRCLQLTRRGGVVGDPCLTMPIFFPTTDDARGAARNDDAAIDGNPAWVALNYSKDSEKKNNVKNRTWYMESKYGQTSCPAVRPEDQCDEFPFYSSEQGGAWDHWTGGQNSPLSTRLLMIPKTENNGEGRMIGAMYNKAECRMSSATWEKSTVPGWTNQLLTNGSWYLTVPLVDEELNKGNKTFYVC
jgi:hypothetical protein